MSVFVVSSSKTFFGKFLTGGPEESSSLASLTFFGVVVEVVVVTFSVVGGRLCHRGSDRLSFLYDVPCQLGSFSSFLPRRFSDLTSSGTSPLS